MRAKIIFTSLACTLACINSYAAKTATFYCAPISAIITTPQTGSWATYEYTSLNKVVKGGLQPALLGWGDAEKAVRFESAVWTDRALACNYTGLTQQQASEIMVMLSHTLGPSPTCQFAAGKDYCHSTNPSDCPMTCHFGIKDL